MSTRFLIYAIILLSVFLMVWIGKETFTQPGVGDLDLEFEETASYRNENNTGPVIRLYAVYVGDTVWQQLKAYGDFMPHTKYGNTKVFFFNEKELSPTVLKPNKPQFDQKSQNACVAVYEKSAMGEVRFRKFPFQ